MSERSFELAGELSAVGGFERQQSAFRGIVEDHPDARFRAEPGRYHLYVSLACPWSHRVVLVRMFKALEQVVGISYVHPYRDSAGWAFAGDGFDDEVNGFDLLSEAYQASLPGYSGRVSVPVLWDTHHQTIVSNESADIVRMLGSAFDEWAGPGDLYPERLRGSIDAVNEWIYRDINNGVYRTGFATTQETYGRSFDALFAALDRAEGILATSRFLTGDALTEADWRLWVTLVRFDRVYHTHFRCNGRRISDYPNLWGFTRELYQRPGVADTVAWDEILEHYYTTHDMLNPNRIIPKGPLDLDFSQPHGREHLPGASG
jgi:putative glutathione S-transferase